MEPNSFSLKAPNPLTSEGKRMQDSPIHLGSRPAPHGENDGTALHHPLSWDTHFNLPKNKPWDSHIILHTMYNLFVHKCIRFFCAALSHF